MENSFSFAEGVTCINAVTAVFLGQVRNLPKAKGHLFAKGHASHFACAVCVLPYLDIVLRFNDAA
jgi:hypothetical protein